MLPLTAERGSTVFYPGTMGSVWVLHTETKGTGATMVPLDSVTKRSRTPERVSVPRKPRRRQPPEPEPSAPRSFRIVDVMSREALADDVSGPEAIEALSG